MTLDDLELLNQIKIKSNLFEDTIIGVKQDFKAGKPAQTEAINTIKDETKQHKIQQESCAIAKMTARCALYKQIVSRCGDMAI